MYSLTRLLFRALRGRPLLQVIVGILLIPVGGLISFAAVSGSDGYIYPYWIIAGIVFAIVGVIFIVRGAMTLLKPKPSVQRAMAQPNPYMGPNQYAQQSPYGSPGSPQYPPGQGYAPPVYPPQPPVYGQPQMPYSQPQAYGQ
ncbi:MAG TPA: hypothetical protein VKU38_16615, partial [Ktedonobacteraceae bacterium]|nr:hypothetical protein [Ktedonobacteraceae bacterium]